MPQGVSARIYTRAERVSDAVVHVTGLVAVLAAVPVLVTLAAVWRGDLPALAGVGVYGACLIAMILCSALYHLVPAPGWKRFLLRLDHSAIYCKIAGTYTPFAVLSGGQGAGLVASLWGAALAGSGLKLLGPAWARGLGVGLYLAMGWAGLAAGWPLLSSLPVPVLVLVVIGGVIYSLGAVVFLIERLPFHNTIWHVCVLAASAVFFAAVLTHLAVTRPALALPVGCAC